MTSFLNELKIPSLALALFMGILFIAKANANFLSNLDSAYLANAQPLFEESAHLACGIQSDEPPLLEELANLPANDE